MSSTVAYCMIFCLAVRWKKLLHCGPWRKPSLFGTRYCLRQMYHHRGALTIPTKHAKGGVSSCVLMLGLAVCMSACALSVLVLCDTSDVITTLSVSCALAPQRLDGGPPSHNFCQQSNSQLTTSFTPLITTLSSPTMAAAVAEQQYMQEEAQMGDENEVSSAFGPGAMNATVGHWVAMASMAPVVFLAGSAQCVN